MPTVTLIYKTTCPYCGTFNCYNSGFSVECVNKVCKFFSLAHHDFIVAQIKLMEKKDLETRTTLTPEQIQAITTATSNSEPHGFTDEEMQFYLPYYYKQ